MPKLTTVFWHSPPEPQALDAGTRLEVHHPRWPHNLSLSYPWLRDHCRCTDCFNHMTIQRRFDPVGMQLNIRPAQVSATPEGLELQCECWLSLVVCALSCLISTVILYFFSLFLDFFFSITIFTIVTSSFSTFLPSLKFIYSLTITQYHHCQPYQYHRNFRYHYYHPENGHSANGTFALI